MVGLTIDSLLEGHEIRRDKTKPNAKAHNWKLDDYPQPFLHKAYAAIAAIAIAEAREGKAEFSFNDFKAYALRVVIADGSVAYFTGERGINMIEVGGEDGTGFSSQIKEVKQQLDGLSFEVDELEELIKLDSRTREKKNSIQLITVAPMINDVARAAMACMKNRKYAPYLLPINDGPRTEFYSLVLENSRS